MFSSHNFIKVAKQSGIKWPCLHEVYYFDAVVQNVMQNSTHFLGCQCFSVYDTVGPLHFRVLISNLCHEPFFVAGHWRSCVSTDTGAGFPVWTIFIEECINNIKNVLSGCFPFQTLTEKCMFPNVVSISVFHKSNKLCLSTDIRQFIQLE